MIPAIAVLILYATSANTGVTQLPGGQWSIFHDDDTCVATTFNCIGGWKALAQTVSEIMREKFKRKQINLQLETARWEMEEAGMDIFEIPLNNMVSLDEDFFHYLEEAIPEMKNHSSNKQYDEYVIKFMRFILNRIHRDIGLLNKTLHIDSVGLDGSTTGLRPIVELLNEHTKNREEGDEDNLF